MYTDPNSYGTGRDPQGRGHHIFPVLLLVLFCITIHGLTLLCFGERESASAEEKEGLILEEIPVRGNHEGTALRDPCGLGLELSDVSELQQQYWSLPEGVFIEQIETDSIAYAAGLRSGDLVLQIEGRVVSEPEECIEVLEALCREEALELVYYRDGEEYSLQIPMEETEE